MSYFRMIRHNFLQTAFLNIHDGDITAVEHGWVETFVLLPHRTINRRWVWFKRVYCRRVWIYTGFVDEPFTQYAELFDVLGDNLQ